MHLLVIFVSASPLDCELLEDRKLVSTFTDFLHSTVGAQVFGDWFDCSMAPIKKKWSK